MPTFPVADRYSYLWLVLGSGLGLFSFADWSVPLAPWLSILCLIRFSHSQPPLRGYLLLCLLGTATPIVHFVWLGVAPAGFPPHMLYGMVIVGTLLMNLAYLADRLITPRIPGLLATLVFPVTLTCWEFVFSTGNPAGNFGAIGYTQHGNLPVMQLVSITGLAGLTFLISWFGSSVNWMWERSFAWPRARPCLVMYGSALAIVLLYGGARLAFHAAPAGTMRVASFTEMDLRTEGAALWPLIRKDRAAFRRLAGEFHDRYFEKTRLQADAGADLVLWPELAIICAAEDEAAILERGKRLAREKRIFLAMPLRVALEGALRQQADRRRPARRDRDGALQVRGQPIRRHRAGGRGAPHVRDPDCNAVRPHLLGPGLPGDRAPSRSEWHRHSAGSHS